MFELLAYVTCVVMMALLERASLEIYIFIVAASDGSAASRQPHGSLTAQNPGQSLDIEVTWQTSRCKPWILRNDVEKVVVHWQPIDRRRV
jgi:hypothetical protein